MARRPLHANALALVAVLLAFTSLQGADAWFWGGDQGCWGWWCPPAAPEPAPAPAPEPTPSPSECTDNFLWDTPQNMKQRDSGYDPHNVDWRGFMSAIDCLGSREHRICTNIIRMFFHDEALDDSQNPPTGADGSVMLSFGESILPQSSQHAEAVMDRYTLGKLAAHFGMSYADGLSVAAAQCTQTFHSPLNIPEYCHLNKLPLKVGKFDFRDVNVGVVNGPLPAGFDPADKWLKFWRQDLNNKVSGGEAWKFSTYEAVALMGSHCLVDNHGCTKADNGIQRTKFWHNNYYQDLLSGYVKVSPKGSNDCPWSNVWNGLGFCQARTPMGADVMKENGCAFDTTGYRRKTHNAEHNIKRAQRDAGISVPEGGGGPQMLDVNWRPDGSRAYCEDASDPNPDPAVGDEEDQCPACGFWDSRAFCKDRSPGEAFWPYTVNDGFLAEAARGPYCWGEHHYGCSFDFPGRDADFNDVTDAFHLFRDDKNSWLENYALGHCKLSNFNAHYYNGDEGVDLTVFTGVGYTGQCSEVSGDGSIQSIINDILGDPPCDVSDPDAPAPAPPCDWWRQVWGQC